MARIQKKTIAQFIMYNIGGFLYFWSAWLIITFGEKYIGLWWANIVGNGVGIIVNYIVQRYFTFGSKNNSNARSGWRFVVLTAVNLVISYYILKGLTTAGIPLWAAQFVSAGFFMGWNWLWYRLWVFRGRR